jgi:phenylpyruvate tautomerase PptA (4-oxalocrotonate tautomerase family)
MPFIEMYVTQGTLDQDAKRTLHERVSRQVLEAEGASYEESDLAKAITWMVIHELPAGSWSVGSEVLSDGEPRIVTRVAVPHDSLDDAKRADIMARVNREIVGALGEELADPTKSFCIIEEHTFGGGGRVVSFADLAGLLGLPGAATGNGSREAAGATAG